MTTLKKFYDLINRNASVTITDESKAITCYTGSLKDIPDRYDDCNVIDFHMDNAGGIHFQIEYRKQAKTTDNNRLWHEGALKVYGDSFHYWVKQYNTPSQYGIDGGRVIKLCIKRDGIEVCNYDRGWDIKPNDPNGELALEILLHEYNV